MKQAFLIVISEEIIEKNKENATILDSYEDTSVVYCTAIQLLCENVELTSAAKVQPLS